MRKSQYDQLEIKKAFGDKDPEQQLESLVTEHAKAPGAVGSPEEVDFEHRVAALQQLIQEGSGRPSGFASSRSFADAPDVDAPTRPDSFTVSPEDEAEMSRREEEVRKKNARLKSYYEAQ